MFRRTLLTLGSALIVTLAVATPAAAHDGDGDPSVVLKNQTAGMTAAQLVTYDQKVALANALDRKQGIIPPSDPATRTLIAHPGLQPAQVSPMSIPGSAELNVSARQQQNNYYCGPTAIQVMSNWAYAVQYSNWFSQDQIAAWAGTTTNGTEITGEKNAANDSLANSPEHNFPYIIARFTSPQQGHTFWSYLSSDVGWSNMPVIANLHPAAYYNGYYYWLSDWGQYELGHYHYILLNGYNGEWNGTQSPGLWFADGSNGYGGGTGVYYDQQYSTFMEILSLYGYIIW